MALLTPNPTPFQFTHIHQQRKSNTLRIKAESWLKSRLRITNTKLLSWHFNSAGNRKIAKGTQQETDTIRTVLWEDYAHYGR